MKKVKLIILLQCCFLTVYSQISLNGSYPIYKPLPLTPPYQIRMTGNTPNVSGGQGTTFNMEYQIKLSSSSSWGNTWVLGTATVDINSSNYIFYIDVDIPTKDIYDIRVREISTGTVSNSIQGQYEIYWPLCGSRNCNWDQLSLLTSFNQPRGYSSFPAPSYNGLYQIHNSIDINGNFLNYSTEVYSPVGGKIMIFLKLKIPTLALKK